MPRIKLYEMYEIETIVNVSIGRRLAPSLFRGISALRNIVTSAGA